MSVHHWDNKVKVTYGGIQHTAVVMDDGTVQSLHTCDWLDVWPKLDVGSKKVVQSRVDDKLAA